MRKNKIVAAWALMCGTLCLLPVMRSEAAPPSSTEAVSADAILKQMSEKLGAARSLSFKARRTIEPDLAGGDGLAGKTEILVKVQRPDKMAATATLPGDTRRFYFDGKHFSLVDEEKYVYSTVPMATTLDQLPAELARAYGFTPPLAEFLVSDLYQDLTWRAEKVEYRGTGTIKSGFLGVKGVRCHRLGLTGSRADSELWVSAKDLLPRRWISKIKRSDGEVVITFELSKWNLKAKAKDKDFEFSADEDFIEIPMVTEADMAAARLAATEQETGGK